MVRHSIWTTLTVDEPKMRNMVIQLLVSSELMISQAYAERVVHTNISHAAHCIERINKVRQTERERE